MYKSSMAALPYKVEGVLCSAYQNPKILKAVAQDLLYSEAGLQCNQFSFSFM
jgi:hypothetical protein